MEVECRRFVPRVSRCERRSERRREREDADKKLFESHKRNRVRRSRHLSKRDGAWMVKILCLICRIYRVRPAPAAVLKALVGRGDRDRGLWLFEERANPKNGNSGSDAGGIEAGG